MIMAFDCGLNYDRNVRTGFDGKQECDYMECEYKCEGVDMEEVIDGILETDNLTYNLYYSGDRDYMLKKVEKYLKNNSVVNFEYLSKKFNENELKNLGLSKNMVNYSNLNNISSIQRLIYDIQLLFKDKFKIHIDIIMDNFPENDIFEIITALKIMIDENITINNKYGFDCYLREQNDLYYLVNGLSVESNSFSDYYVKNPHIKSEISFIDILSDIQLSSSSDIIEKICSANDDKEIIKYIKMLSIDIQEILIENSIICIVNGVDAKKNLRDIVVKYFENYIFELDNVWISTRLYDEQNILRVYIGNEWKDGDEKYMDMINREKEEKKGELDENPYGYYGKYNPDRDIFCIVNIVGQKQKKDEKIEELKKKYDNDEITEKEYKKKMEKIIGDTRVVSSGKNCASWTIGELLSLVIKTLKINYPDDFRVDDDIDKLLLDANKNKLIKDIYGNQINKLDDDDLRRALYWTMSSNKKKPIICKVINDWFREANLLIPDKQCGSSGHKKAKKQVEEKKIYFSRKLDGEDVKRYEKDISKVKNDIFKKVRGYKPVLEDGDNIILIYSKTKIIGFMVYTTDIIKEVNIITSYTRKDKAVIALREVLCKGEYPLRIDVDKGDDDSDKLIKLYESYGFNKVKVENNITVFRFKC